MAGSCGYFKAVESLKHVPQKAAPDFDPGWMPVLRKRTCADKELATNDRDGALAVRGRDRDPLGTAGIAVFVGCLRLREAHGDRGCGRWGRIVALRGRRGAVDRERLGRVVRGADIAGAG